MSKEWNEQIAIVFLRDQQIFGEVLRFGAHASLIKYEFDGEELVEWIENDDFVVWENIILKHEEWD